MICLDPMSFWGLMIAASLGGVCLGLWYGIFLITDAAKPKPTPSDWDIPEKSL